MDIQKFTIRRNTPDTGSTGTIPCTGGTNFYPINLSTNCSGDTMYNSTGSQIMSALDSGVMSSFPDELKDCSPTIPCVILWDAALSPNPNNCYNPDGYSYVKFKGLVLTSGGTFYTGSYNDLITIYDVTNTNINQPLNSQGVNAFWGESVEICSCLDPLDDILYKLPLTLTQDFNDIGHYSIWDGRIDQQQVFSNFTFTANTTGNGMKIQVYNTTNFGSYKEFQQSPYRIDWGECDCSIPVNANGYPCCEDLQYPSLTSEYEYVNPSQYSIKITHEGPWGPTSVSQIITVPNLTYTQILAQPFSSAPPTGAGMGGAAVGAGVALSPTTPGGNPYQVNLSGPNPTPSVTPPPMFTSTAYHGTYGTIGTPNYYPLDSGTNINQYSGTSIGCFELTGITESSVGIFSTYSNVPSTTAPGFLPNGFEKFVTVPVGGDVIDPLTNTITAGMMGEIFEANAIYTGYTISSANGQTPIDFYDFPNGITIFVATSCGLNSLAFGGEDCFECPEETCEFCLTKDEYIDRVTLTVETITPNPPSNPPNWSPFVDYVKGDIVYDVTPQSCCCYIAVTDITQTSNTGGNSPFAGILPHQLYQGVYINPTGPDVHVWEGCTPDCVSCPTGSALPCEDPYNIFNAYSPMGTIGIAGQWNNTQVFNAGEFIYGPDGNCYRAINNVPAGIVPTATTNVTSWDYVGCASWVCPQDLTNVGVDVCELISGSTPNSFTFYAGPGGCLTAYNNGNCPVDDRWHCPNQYNCDTPGCIQIDYTHPQYNNPGYPLSVTFSSMTDCEDWCNPIAWSCTTPTNTPCCSEVSCAALPDSDYYDIMTNYILATAQVTATNNQLFLDPFYTLNDCETGVPGQGISACCDFTAWEYFCDTGCVQITGGNYPTSGDCASDPNNLGGLPGPCGWDCYDPWYQPCSGGTGFPGSTTCVPCYTNGCGQYNTSADCCTYCNPPLTDCWVCLSGSATPCQNLAPCPTPLPTWEADWAIDPALVPLSGFGANPNPTDPTLALLYPNGSYATAQDCDDNCPTDGGIDCLVSLTNGSSYGNCANYPNPVALPSGWGWSPGGPYDSYSACCIATGCCDIECDENSSIFNPMSGLYDPSWPYWPCVYTSVAVGSANIPCSPLGPVYCTFTECVTANPNGCIPDGETCECACDPFTGGVGVDREEWDSTANDYELYDYVAWQVGAPDVCCYYCDVPMGSNPYVGPPAGFYDCNYFIPGGPDAPNGTPNAWISCGSTPSGNTVGGCDPCQQVDGDTYSCDFIDGCVLNVIPCNFVLGSEAANNCYTASTCMDHCKAGCFCDDNGTPSDPSDDFTDCVMQQDVINGVTTNSSSWYGFLSVWQCQQGILAPPPGNLNCCSGATSKFHCDDTEWCSSLNPCVAPDGCGCIEVFPGDPLYPTAAYTTLSDCQQNCKWACDPSSTGGQCQFVGNNPLNLFPEHTSAFDCWSNTNNCNCTAPSVYFCDTNAGQSATTTNCFPETTIISWIATPPFPGWTQNQVLGQQGTGTPYPAGATGFASLGDCQAACRFCCDTNVSCTCDLNPYNFSCALSIGDCISLQTQYPCCPQTTEYCCDETLGCISFVGTMPASCVHGPFTTPTQCQDECNFICGECKPDLGPIAQPDPCHCSLITIPFYSAVPPYGACTAYNTLADCTANSYPLGGTGSNNTTCCPCEDCKTAGSVTFPVIDATGTWSLSNVVIPTPIVGSVLATPAWTPAISYNIGDVVIDAGGSGGTLTSCCFVMVYDQYDHVLHSFMNPHQWYDAYANELANNTPSTFPGGQPNGGYPMWVPCDTSCPSTAATPTMYECLPGQPVYTVCSNATLEYPINPVGTTGFGAMGINAGTSSWHFPQIFFDWIVQTYPPNTPFASKKAVSPNASNASCPNPDPNQYGGAGGIFRTTPHCHSSNVIYTTANGCPQSVTFLDWNDAIAQLNLVNANLSLPQTFNTGMNVQEARDEMTSYGETAIGLFAGTSSCQCSQIGPCSCQQCTSGLNCVYPNLALCNIAATATPCCQPPQTGYYVCDTGNPNVGTGVCPCVWDANAIVGYNTISDCTGDTSTCCYQPTPTMWKCSPYPATTSGWSGWDGYLIQMNTLGATALNHFTIDAADAQYLVSMGQSQAYANTIINAGYFPDELTALQVFFAKARGLGYDFDGPNSTLAGTSVNAYYFGISNYVSDVQCFPYTTQPGLQQSPDCFVQVSDGTYRLKRLIVNTTIPSILGGTSSALIYFSENTYWYGVMMGSCITNASQNIIYSPSQAGSPQYSPDGYLLDLALLISTINNDQNIPCNPGPSAPTEALKVISRKMCRPPCECYQDPSGVYSSLSQCELDPTNCCDTIIPDSWDCVNCPGTCNCLDPGTGLGQYQSLGACQTVCVDPVSLGCEDCDITLGNVLTGPSNYLGNYSPAITYQINDCVVSDDDNCCYCCVPAGPLPNSTNPYTSQSLQTMLFQVVAPPVCKNGQGDPSSIIGININGGMWLPCNVDVNNDPCGTGTIVECDVCNTTLYNDLPTPVSFPHQTINTAYTSVPFQVGECIYNVDPTDVNENCCWCCGCEFGWDIVDNKCLEPPAGPNSSTARSAQYSSVMPPPCQIVNMDPGSGDPNTGDFIVNNGTYNSAWLPCGVNSLNNPCGGANSSSSSSIVPL